MKSHRFRQLTSSLQEKFSSSAKPAKDARSAPALTSNPDAPLPPSETPGREKRSSAKAIFERITRQRQPSRKTAPVPTVYAPASNEATTSLAPAASSLHATLQPLPADSSQVRTRPVTDTAEDLLEHTETISSEHSVSHRSNGAGERRRYLVDASSEGSAPAADWQPVATPAAPKLPFVPRERNWLASSAAQVGRKLQPNQVVVDGAMPLVSYRIEPAGRFDSQGYHKPGDNYSTLENKHMDYRHYAYEPITHELSPGKVRKGRPHLNTAYLYGAEKLIARDGKPARYPIPAWMRQIGTSVSHGAGNLMRKRLSRPKALLTRARADAMLENRKVLASRVGQLFGIPDGADGAARIEALLASMDYMGTESYPVPAYQKQIFLVEALAISCDGDLTTASAAIAQLRQGLDPVALIRPATLPVAVQRSQHVLWRTAQILSTSGGDGFDTLLKAGAVHDTDTTVLLPGETRPAQQRRQEALRIFLEVAAQSDELAISGKGRPGKITFQSDTRRYLAQLAAVKLWTNPQAGDIGPGSTVPPGERLTRPEKNAYYEWSQNFGRLGAEGMVNKTRDRLHKVATTYMDRAQAIGFDDWPTLDSVDPRRAVGMNKSPMTALQFGTRGAHLRTPNEIRTQYDTILRPLLRQLTRHYESKVRSSTDYTSLVRNLIDLESTRYWNAHANLQDASGAYLHRPLGGKLTPAAQAEIFNAVRATLSETRPDRALPPAQRSLIPGPDAFRALSLERSWISRTFRKNTRFSLDNLTRIVQTEGLGPQVMSDTLLAEFGLNAANRKNLGPEMAKYRLFGNDGSRPATVQNFLERARHIRNSNDSLKPVMGSDGSAITALKEFNDTYIREEPMGPRVRAQDGGVYGFNNIGLALNMAHVYVAPNPSFSNDKRAFVEYNSGGHAFEVAYGVQKTVNAGMGVSAGHGFVLPDGSIISATGTLGAGMDWTNQEAVRLRGRRELNDNGEAYLVADDPGGPNHGRQLSAAQNASGEPLMVDVDGRLATSTDMEGGYTRYTYEDRLDQGRQEVVYKSPTGDYLDRHGEVLLDSALLKVYKHFGKAYVYADDGQPANDVARMDKPRYHLMQATDFMYRYAAEARRTGDAGTSAGLWDAWVDEFFDNRNVSISYQHHRNVGQSVSGQVGVTARHITDADARPGGGVAVGHTERPYEALNRTDQTGSINRTLVQIGYSGNNNVLASTSVATPGLGGVKPEVTAGGLGVKLGGVNATFGDHGVLAAFRTVETDGKIVPEFTYMDIEYRGFDSYKKYVLKNRKVWEAFYGKENLEKHLEKLERDAEPNQRFSERWRLSPEGVHKLRSYLALAKIQQAGARGDGRVDNAELKKIEAEEITRFAAQMLEDRNLWDPLGAYVVEVNSKERAIGPNFLVQAQQITRSVADAELDWLGGSSAGMNNADRLRAERDAERQQASERRKAADERASRGEFLPPLASTPEPFFDMDALFPRDHVLPRPDDDKS